MTGARGTFYASIIAIFLSAPTSARSVFCEYAFGKFAYVVDSITHGYNVGRGLPEYKRLLSDAFQQDLKTQNNGPWYDFGSGNNRALFDYHGDDSYPQKMRTVGFVSAPTWTYPFRKQAAVNETPSIKENHQLAWGRALERHATTTREAGWRHWLPWPAKRTESDPQNAHWDREKATIGTDFYGAFSYAKKVDRVLYVEGHYLQKGASLYIFGRFRTT